MFSNDFQKIVTLDVLWWEKMGLFYNDRPRPKRHPNHDPTLAQP